MFKRTQSLLLLQPGCSNDASRVQAAHACMPCMVWHTDLIKCLWSTYPTTQRGLQDHQVPGFPQNLWRGSMHPTHTQSTCVCSLWSPRVQRGTHSGEPVLACLFISMHHYTRVRECPRMFKAPCVYDSDACAVAFDTRHRMDMELPRV